MGGDLPSATGIDVATSKLQPRVWMNEVIVYSTVVQFCVCSYFLRWIEKILIEHDKLQSLGSWGPDCVVCQEHILNASNEF